MINDRYINSYLIEIKEIIKLFAKNEHKLV